MRLRGVNAVVRFAAIPHKISTDIAKDIIERSLRPYFLLLDYASYFDTMHRNFGIFNPLDKDLDALLLASSIKTASR